MTAAHGLGLGGNVPCTSQPVELYTCPVMNVLPMLQIYEPLKC